MPLNLSSWFAPIARNCPVCGRTASRGINPVSVPVKHPEPRRILTSLCGACRQCIPWIAYPVCRICGRAERCEDCVRRQNRHYAFSRSAVRYDQRMKEWLALYKYRGNEGLEGVLAAMLSFAYERLREVSQYGFDAITAVPLAPERQQDRGYNQAERLATRLAEWYGLSYRPLLLRLRHTEKQSLKTRRSRVTDMRGIFSAIPSDSLSERIILVDDIYTTGSTLDECARVLTQAVQSGMSREVYGVLWARS